MVKDVLCPLCVSKEQEAVCEVDYRLLASGLMSCLCHWQDNDFLRNRVHRHEPPVTAEPVRLLAENEDVVVVDKPSSIPVHPCGRFRHNTVIFILGKEHQLKELHPLHRLDRLTSGVLMFAKTAAVSERIHEQVRDRQVSWASVSCMPLPGLMNALYQNCVTEFC